MAAVTRNGSPGRLPITNEGVRGGDAKAALFGGLGIAAASIEGWPCASLAEFDVVRLDENGLRDRLDGPPLGGVAVLELSPSCSMATHFLPSPAALDPERQRFLAALCHRPAYAFPAQILILIDEPCFVVPQSGAVFRADGKVLRESIYNSLGAPSIERLIGGGIRHDDLPTLLSAAPPWRSTPTPPSLLLSRWSEVYTHALAETLTHDAALRRCSLTDRVVYAVPVAPQGCQNLILDEVSRHRAACEVCPAPIMRVPRVLISSLLYTFAVYGPDWKHFAETLRADASQIQRSEGAQPARRVYVSRLGAAARRMRNEPELIDAMRSRDFSIFTGKGLDLRSQAAAFRDASLIVGPHGSGLVNAAFASPGATLFELRPLNRPQQTPMWDDSYIRTSAGSGLTYLAHVSANPPEQEDWNAAIPEILAEVDRLIAG